MKCIIDKPCQGIIQKLSGGGGGGGGLKYKYVSDLAINFFAMLLGTMQRYLKVLLITRFSYVML